MIHKIFRTLIVLFVVGLPFSAAAQSTFSQSGDADVTMQQDTGYLVTYIGRYGIVQDRPDGFQFGIEYRAESIFEGLRPMIGFNIESDGATLLYAGAYWDIQIADLPIYVSPTLAIGYYSAGSSQEMGGPIEFRSGVEISYEFENQNRIGATLTHISNANIYQQNPGSETLLISFHIPIK